MSGRPDPDDDAQVVAREREHYLARLRQIPGERASLDRHERELVRYARLIDISWDDIAAAIGHEDNITVQEKYGEPGPGAEPF